MIKERIEENKPANQHGCQETLREVMQDIGLRGLSRVVFLKRKLNGRHGIQLMNK